MNRLVLFFASALAICACSPAEPSKPAHTPLSIDPASVEIVVGNTAEVTIIKDANAAKVSTKSENPEIASVLLGRKGCIITANKVGETNIVTREFDKDGAAIDSAFCKVSVIKAPRVPLSVSPESVEIYVGTTQMLSDVVTVTSDPEAVRIESGIEGSSVATISEGVLSGIAEGTTRIYVREYDAGSNKVGEVFCELKVKGYPKNALTEYWKSGYQGPKGLQQGTRNGTPLFMLAGLPVYVSGVNCYDLFNGDLTGSGHSNAWHTQVVARLAENQVPIVRFNCGIFGAGEFNSYYNSGLKDQYLSCLEDLARQCDENHILLIPSFFWNYEAIPQALDDAPTLQSGARSYTAWGNPQSKTYKMMLQYTEDVVSVLKSHKCIAAWEFGNELNLQADLYKANQAMGEIYTANVVTAYKGFADLVHSLDPEGRVICSGNSIMRNYQYNRWKTGSGSTDSYNQYVTVSAEYTPGLMNGMSEHIYDGETRKFSDYGTVSDRNKQLEYALKCAKENNKVYYVGEFSGPAGTAMNNGGGIKAVKSHFDSYEKMGIQISLVWNYAMTCNVEWSFNETQIVQTVNSQRVKTNSKDGASTLQMVRDLNEQFRRKVVE